MTITKPTNKITFRDLLSHLNFETAAKLLGPDGRRLIMAGAKREIDIRKHVVMTEDSLQVTFPEANSRQPIQAAVIFDNHSRDRLRFTCSECEEVCEHIGAMTSMILESKTPLGLAAPPKERKSVDSLSEPQLVSLAILERQQRAKAERMKISTTTPDKPWSDYVVTSTISGKSYRVALRGFEPGVSYCSCPDFRTNTLGTCKHLIKVEALVRRKFTAIQLKSSYRRKRVSVHLKYADGVELHVAAASKMSKNASDLLRPFLDGPVKNVPQLVRVLQKLSALSEDFQVYPDAEEFIEQQLHRLKIEKLVEEIRSNPAEHPFRENLLKAKLLPYQLDGIAFAAAAGRAVLADDMGLGKTIQGVGLAELLAQQSGIEKVLVICPASLKSQWRNEIHRFCDRSVQLISGPISERRSHYATGAFFTVCNYEQVLKDILDIESVNWDLIILDEGQRIKNWESKTSRVIKGLKSKFALVLSGTPLENRLDELYSVIQFIDARRLGPGFRFFNQHRMVDEKGKVLGYKNMEMLRQSLRPILLRRTRDSVKLELPELVVDIIRIPPTEEQKNLHDTHMQTVATIVAKPFITEMDLLRLRMSLLMCRMAANGTFLVNKQKPNYSTKLERLAELFDDIAEEMDRKVLLFSEWTTMLDIIEPLLKKRRMPFVRLDGSVPQAKRQAIVHEFQTNPLCRFLLMTNAGSTGLNLQSANTVINVDLPWNPAILSQRIARAHRMGQKQNVQVINLVTEKTLEENLLVTLEDKRDLALAALDPESTVDVVTMTSGNEALRERLEVLLGAKPEAFVDRSQKNEQRSHAQVNNERRDKVAAAGGEMLGAVFQFLGTLVENDANRQQIPEDSVQAIRNRLDSCLETSPEGKPRLSFTLPNADAVDNLARTLAQLMAANSNS